MQFTAKETVVIGALPAFFNYDTAKAEKDDNVVFFELGELARAAEMEVRSARSVCQSLVKKGVLETVAVNETSGFGVTDAGIDAAYQVSAAGETAVEDAAAAEKQAVEDAVKGLEAALRDRLGRLSKCQALRETAKNFEGGRSIFITAAENCGINKGTAARQWQEARATNTVGMDEGAKTRAFNALMEMAQDELVEMLMGRLTRAEIKNLAGE